MEWQLYLGEWYLDAAVLLLALDCVLGDGPVSADSKQANKICGPSGT